MSRSTIFEFKPVTPEDVAKAVRRAFTLCAKEMKKKISLEEGVKPTHPSKGGYNRGGRGGQRGGRRPSGGPRRNSGAPKSDAPQRAPKTDAGAKGVSLYGKLN